MTDRNHPRIDAVMVPFHLLTALVEAAHFRHHTMIGTRELKEDDPEVKALARNIAAAKELIVTEPLAIQPRALDKAFPMPNLTGWELSTIMRGLVHLAKRSTTRITPHFKPKPDQIDIHRKTLTICSDLTARLGRIVNT